MTFDQLELSEPLRRGVRAEGYTTPTPIQERAIPHALRGRDVLGVAQTGTGKTAAFALPILDRLSREVPGGARSIRCLVLTPTRELAAQVCESFVRYGRHLPLQHAVVFGGVGQTPQVQVLRRGVDVLVATPGRLLDLMGQGVVSLKRVEVFVLDEADRMLDMGFLPDVRRVIAALPRERQTLFFSATMPPDITALARQILTEPVRIEVTPPATTVETVEQRVYFVAREHKRELLVHLLEEEKVTRALIFTRTKHGADKVARQLIQAGVDADAIHGNKSQGARERALEGFRSGDLRVLVATDIAARGIDIDAVSHVINYELPNVPEQYVHRIGRTARAGAAGVALSLCDSEERSFLHDIERTIRRAIDVVDHPFGQGASAPVPPSKSAHGHGATGASHRRQPPRRTAPHAHGRGVQPKSQAAAPPPAAPPSKRYLKWG